MISSRQDSAVAEISNRDAAAATLNKSQSIEVMPEQNEEKSAANQPVDLESIKDAVRVILKAVGEDPDRDGLLETPAVLPRCTRKCSPACIKMRGVIWK